MIAENDTGRTEDGTITFTQWVDWLEALLGKLNPEFEFKESGRNIWGPKLCG